MKETKIAKNSKVIITIIILVIIGLGVIYGTLGLFRNMDEIFEARMKLNCADYFIFEAGDYFDLMQLCENEECKDYFKEKIEFNTKMVEECLE